ncbi:anthranilate phosphoribosyltransferase [soil metagenome]
MPNRETRPDPESGTVDDAIPLRELLRAAAERPLSAEEAETAFTHLMEGRGSPVETAALLVAIRVRGAHPAEVAGGVRALRRAMVSVPAERPEELVDTCGTGGGSLVTYNISTVAALIAAAAGVRIAKHGNRSFTSRCGSADVLEELGVRLDLTPEREAEVLREAGVVFMFAPLHHPAMRHVAPVRRELGMPTLMNVLGPLTNPAGAARQVVGVSDPAYIPLIAGGLKELGHRRALVVHGAPGLDEISPLGVTEGLELRDGEIRPWRYEPEATDGDGAAELACGDPARNAGIVRGILSGEVGGAARSAALLNAAAALYVSGRVESLGDGVVLAERALDDGSASERLAALRAASGGGA